VLMGIVRGYPLNLLTEAAVWSLWAIVALHLRWSLWWPLVGGAGC